MLVAQPVAGLVDLDDGPARRRRRLRGWWRPPRARRGRTLAGRREGLDARRAPSAAPSSERTRRTPSSSGSSWSAASQRAVEVVERGQQLLGELDRAALLRRARPRARRACGSSRSRPGCAARARGTRRAAAAVVTSSSRSPSTSARRLAGRGGSSGGSSPARRPRRRSPGTLLALVRRLPPTWPCRLARGQLGRAQASRARTRVPLRRSSR